MRRAIVAFVVVVVATTAAADPCKRPRGTMIGTSACVAYDVASKRVMPSKVVVTAGKGVASSACKEPLVLGAITLEVECKTADNRTSATVSVRPVGGEWIRLDRHDGFFDFVDVWAKRDNGLIRFTIDYGVLE